MTETAEALAAFLAARLDEDEAVARRNIGASPGKQNGLGDTDDGGPMWPDYQTFDGDDLDAAYDYLKRFRPLRALREVAFKRSVLEWHYPGLPPEGAPEGLEICAGEEGDGDTWQMATPWPCPQIRALAAIWSDHPDYRPEWALADAETRETGPVP